MPLVIWWRNRREDLSQVKRYHKKEIAKLFVIALPVLILPFIIRAAVIEGVATATEVSTIRVAYTVLVGAVYYRHFDIKRAWSMLIDTASLSGAIIFIIGAATAMAWGLTQSGFSKDLATLMASLGGGMTFVAISVVAFIILGSVLEDIPFYCAVRASAVPDCTRFGRTRSALRHGCSAGNGHWAVRAAVWRWLLRLLRGQ
ncbi:TRAP transporter large permease subunit [Candidatus Symbiopectobacterium endolongispinus]|nr:MULTISPECIES: TRAP transporter large permease subunit [Symbiopectobacterium]MBT9430258.1 TRAP transporter large permease subunit [Candidatus Symbiopectobacterium endolongispinus]